MVWTHSSYRTVASAKKSMHTFLAQTFRTATGGLGCPRPHSHRVAGVLRGNTIRGNMTRNSERKMALWEVSKNLWKPLKTSKNLWKPLKTSENLPLRNPLRDPLRGRFPSQNLSVLLPLIVCPLTPPPPNQQNARFPLDFLLKGPQTELRTLNQNCEQTLQKLRTNRITNKRAFLKNWSQCVFWTPCVLLRKALNRNLSWGFPLGNLLLKTRVLKHRVLERKRRPNANASVLGTLRFRTLSAEPLGFCRRVLQNLWGSAGGFSVTFCIVDNLPKNPHTEPQRFCRTLGAKPGFSYPANSSPTETRLIVARTSARHLWLGGSVQAWKMVEHLHSSQKLLRN